MPGSGSDDDDVVRWRTRVHDLERLCREQKEQIEMLRNEVTRLKAGDRSHAHVRPSTAAPPLSSSPLLAPPPTLGSPPPATTAAMAAPAPAPAVADAARGPSPSAPSTGILAPAVDAVRRVTGRLTHQRNRSLDTNAPPSPAP
jgi:hypothetical protein